MLSVNLTSSHAMIAWLVGAEYQAKQSNLWSLQLAVIYGSRLMVMSASNGSLLWTRADRVINEAYATGSVTSGQRPGHEATGMPQMHHRVHTLMHMKTDRVSSLMSLIEILDMPNGEILDLTGVLPVAWRAVLHGRVYVSDDIGLYSLSPSTGEVLGSWALPEVTSAFVNTTEYILPTSKKVSFTSYAVGQTLERPELGALFCRIASYSAFPPFLHVLPIQLATSPDGGLYGEYYTWANWGWFRALASTNGTSVILDQMAPMLTSSLESQIGRAHV